MVKNVTRCIEVAFQMNLRFNTESDKVAICPRYYSILLSVLFSILMDEDVADFNGR